MKKLFIIFTALICQAVYSQDFKSLTLDSNTTFTAMENGMFIGDTLFMKGFEIYVDPVAQVRFEVIIGPGKIFLYPGSLLGVAEKVPPDVEVYAIDPRPKKTPQKVNKG